MTTSDGISDEDWSLVEQYAEQIVAASSADLNSTLLVSNLLKFLNKLKVTYGRLPSILATEAGYVEDKELELSLLKEAYIAALEIKDNKNISFISASLAEFYLEDKIDINRAEFWRMQLKHALKLFSDSYLSAVLSDVTQKIAALKSNKDV